MKISQKKRKISVTYFMRPTLSRLSNLMNTKQAKNLETNISYVQICKITNKILTNHI